MAGRRQYGFFCLKEVEIMAKVCDICKKGKLSGNTVSHSHRRGNRTWTPNLKKVRAEVNGSHVTLNVCTRCIRSGKVNALSK